MAVSRHVAVVRALRRGRLEQAAARADDGFPAYAARQHLAHWALGTIEREGAAALFPGAWREVLRAEVDRRAGREAQLPAALAEAWRALGAAGVPARVLKGLPFAQRYYGDTRLRRCVDVDLLVPRAATDRALRALWSLGYHAKSRRVAPTPRGPRLRRRRTEHGLALHRAGLHVDLHWRLRTAPAYRLAETDVWARPERVEVAGGTYDVLSDEYALVLLLLSIAHDLGRCGCRLKHLLDVDRLLARASLDWDAFLAARARENTLALAVNVLGIVLDVFDSADEHPALARALARRRRHRVAPGEASSLALVHLPRGRAEAALWFLRVYPVRWGRDALWLLDRTLTHPGRLYLVAFRALRFTAALVAYGARAASRHARSAAR